MWSVKAIGNHCKIAVPNFQWKIFMLLVKTLCLNFFSRFYVDNHHFDLLSKHLLKKYNCLLPTSAGCIHGMICCSL